MKISEKREFLRFFAYFSAITRPAFAPVSQAPFRTPQGITPQRKNLRGVLTAIACASFAVLILQLAKIVPFSQSSPFPFMRTPRLAITEQFVRSGEMPKLIITEEAPWFLPWIAPKPFSGTIERVELISPRKDLLKPSFATTAEGAGQTIILEQVLQIHPGDYEARVFVRDGTEQLLTRHFRWGVVAVNVRTSIAAPGEHREVHIAVLDDYGRTECQSTVLLKVTDPTGETRDYSTKKGTVTRNPNCRDRSVTNLPDYRALIVPSIPGEYRIGVTASTKDGPRTMIDHFSVGAIPGIQIARSAFPTRIYPPAVYPVQFRFTPEQDIGGQVIETVPIGFSLSNISGGGTAATLGEGAVARQQITWKVQWKAGESYTLGYTFDAPNISPLLYHLGPVTILDDRGEKIVSESRQWQIAADAIKTWDGGAAGASWSTCTNWDADACPNAGDDIVFDGTSNDASTWDSLTFYSSVGSISVTSMSGLLTLARSGQTVTGDFSHTSTGGVTFSSDMTIGGNYTMTTSGTFTPGTTTITMNGTGGKNINTAKTHYNLTIDPSSAATINVVTSSLAVSNTLSVASGDTLAIASGITLNHNGATLTLNGTISGPGRLTYRSTTAFPTTGTLSGTLILRFDTNDGNQTVSGRTDYGVLELYNKSTSARTVTLGSGASQTITSSSHMYLMAESNTGGANLTVSATTNDPVLNVGGDLDFTGTGTTSEILNPPDTAKDWTVSGNVDFSNGTYNGSAETLKMNGNGVNLIGNGQTVANLNINGSTNTVNITTSDVTIVTLLTVGSNNTLSVGSGRTVTLNAISGTTLTLDGTVSGSGTLVYKTNTTFPTTGTISAYLRIDLTNANCSVPARTFGGNLELYSNVAVSARTATLGTGALQTITVSGSFYLAAANTGGIAATGAANAPTMNISGSVDYTGGGAGTESITTGAGAWTVGGDIDLRNGNFTATSGNLVTMTGTSNTLYGNARTFYDLTIDPSSTGTITETGGSGVGVSHTLTVAANDTLTTNGYLDLTSTSATTLVLNGTINGPGVLYYYTSVAFPSTGTISCWVYFYPLSVDMSVPGRTFGGDVLIEADNTTLHTVTFGSAGGQTVTINGFLDISALSTANVVVDAATYDPTVTVLGARLDFIGTGSGTEVINAGTGTWTVSGDVTLTDGQYNIESGNTLIMNGTSKTLTSASQTLGNLTLSGSITLANATHTVSGNLSMAGGTVTAGTSTLTMTGTSNTITGGGNTLANLTIDPATAGTITLQTSDLTVSSTLTVAAGDTLSIAASRTLTHTGATLTWGDGTSTISGSGTLRFTDASGGPGTGGVLSAVTRFDASSANIASTTFDARTYSGKVELYANSGTAKTVSCADASTYTISGASSHLYLFAEGAGDLSLLCDTATDPTVSIGGDLDYQGLAGGSEAITTGAGTWTVSGSVDFTGGTATVTAGNTFRMNGTSKTLTSVSQSFRNFAITGGSVSNVDAMDVNGTFDVTSGGFTAASNSNMNVSGNFTLASGTTFTGPSGGVGRLILDGDLTLTDNNGTKQDLGDVQIGTSPDTTNLASDTTYKSLTVTSADFFYTNGYDIDVNGTITISGTFDATDDVELDETTVNCAGNFTINAGATFVQDQSTLIMDATSLTKDLITDGSFSLYNLTLNDAGGSLTVEVEDPLDVDNTLTITGGTLDTVATENNQINVGGNWDNDDTFTARSGIVVMDAGSGTKTIDADGTGTDAFYALTFNDAAGTATYQLTTAADIDNNLTITGGNFDANSNNITVGGNWDNDDTFTSGTQTTTFDAASGTKTIDADGTGTEAFSSVTFNDAGGGTTWQLTTLMDVDSNLTITGGTVDFNGSNTLSVGGNFTNSDTMVQSTGTLQMDGASGTKTIDTSEAVSAAANDYNNITFNDGGGTATYKTIYPLDLDNNLTITGGTLDMTGPTTWYLTNDSYNAQIDNWRMKYTDPAGSADDTSYCDDNVGSAGWCTILPGQPNATWNGSSPSTITQTGWMLNNGVPITGSIATGTWTLAATVNYTVGSCSYGTKTINARLWKANADLTSATALTAWTSGGTLLSGVNNYTVTFSSVAAQALSNQVIYVEAAIRLATPACGGGVNSTFAFRVNQGGTTQKLTTPAFTPQINLAGSWDNNDLFTHANGAVVFDAGATGKTIEAGTSSFYDATVNNASGGWTVQTDDMTVANNLTLTAGSAWTVATGRTLQVQGTYSQVIAAANTTWTGSTLYLNGSGGMYDINSKTHGGDTYATIRVGASEDIATWDSSATTYTMDAGACLFSEDHGATAGRLNIYGTCNSRSNEYWSYATDFDGTALGGSSRQANVQSASGATLTVDSGDTLAILGQTAAANRTLVSRQSSGNYGITVNGTINAQYYDFDYLDASGLNITSTATVTELSDGTFDNAAAGASSSYITVAGITQTKTFNTNVFDDATDGTDSNVVYNVNADGAGINWTFSDYDGNKGGESFDNETTGATVTWIARPNLTFSVSANSVDLGVINPWAVSTGNHTITVTTTALSGYTCKVTEDGNLRNGSNDINDVSGGTVDAGSEEYGINCSGGGCALGSDSVISGTPLTVATSVGPVTNEATTMAYKAAVSAITNALGYTHIVTYTCTGNF